MKITEIIIESKHGSPPVTADKSNTGEWIFRDDGTDRFYNLDRIMRAAAISDGKSTKAVDMPSSSWVEKNNVARPYTEEEHNMMKAAFKTIGDSSYEESGKNHRSREQDDTHTISPFRVRTKK